MNPFDDDGPAGFLSVGRNDGWCERQLLFLTLSVFDLYPTRFRRVKTRSPVKAGLWAGHPAAGVFWKLSMFSTRIYSGRYQTLEGRKTVIGRSRWRQWWRHRRMSRNTWKSITREFGSTSTVPTSTSAAGAARRTPDRGSLLVWVRPISTRSFRTTAPRMCSVVRVHARVGYSRGYACRKLDDPVMTTRARSKWPEPRFSWNEPLVDGSSRDGKYNANLRKHTFLVENDISCRTREIPAKYRVVR